MNEVKPLTKQHEKLFSLLENHAHGLKLRGISETTITLYPSQWALIETVLSGKHRAPPGLNVQARTYRGHALRRMET